MPAHRFPLEVIVTPRFDLFYALHARTSSAPTPLDEWRDKAAARLSRDFARLTRRLAPVPIFWPLLADALGKTPGAMTFDEILSALRAMPPHDLRVNVLSGIFHHRPTVEALAGRKKTLAEVLRVDDHPDAELLKHFGLRPYLADSAAPVAISFLISDTIAYRDELTGLLQKFLQSGFGSDWSQLEPAFLSDVNELTARGEENPIADLAAELRLPVTFDENTGAMQTRSGTVVKLRQIERCYLLPSAFNTRRWWAKYDTGDRVTLYFPIWGGPKANSLVMDGAGEKQASRDRPGPRGPRVNAEAVFRALGDTTRYAIASILARKPTSSADLSRSLRVSKPTITHHVQALRAAGLITQTAAGGSSRLSLNRETLAGLSAAAIEELYSSSGELSLLTTRQRRTT
ncbi:MAG TPA: winged helix-turn-helix domain-containing protein [Gemmatimonadaceae bacterium]|nr:winged helix-turn-helix domain-containing protein [Gemmatimonadaceae bacterium]